MLKKRLTVYLAGFFAALAAILVLRLVLVFGFTDLRSGFYTGGGTAVTVLGIITAAAAVWLFSALFVIPKNKGDMRLPDADRMVAWHIVCAIALCAGGIGQFSLLFQTLKGAYFLSGIFTFFAAAYFALAAVRGWRSGMRHAPYAALLPVVWAAVHLIVTWTQYTVIVNIPAYLFDMLKMVSFMLFFYYYARYAGGVPAGRERAGLYSFGLLSLLFGITSAVPAFAAAFRQAGSPGPEPLDNVATLAVCAFIAALLWHLPAPETDAPALPARGQPHEAD